MVLLAKPLTSFELKYKEHESMSNILVPETKKSLLDAFLELGIPMNRLKQYYEKGLSLILACIEAHTLFERFDGTVNFCPECGKNIKSSLEPCKHEIDYYDLWDNEMEYFDYLNFMSFERFLLLKEHKPDLLEIFRVHGIEQKQLRKGRKRNG